MTVDSSPHFSREELQCPCGCGRCEMSPDFMAQLELVRAVYGKPMRVSSGFRCPDYNEKISSTGRSGPHTKGVAVDIVVYGRDAYELLRVALQSGMKGVGVKQNGEYKKRFLHLDMGDGPLRPRVWSY